MLWLYDPPEGLLHLPPLQLCGGGDPGGALALDGQRATPDVQLQLLRHLEVVELVVAVRVVHDVSHGQPGQEDQLDQHLGKYVHMKTVKDAAMVSKSLFGEV